MLAIIKIVCDRIEGLKPVSHFFGGLPPGRSLLAAKQHCFNRPSYAETGRIRTCDRFQGSNTDKPKPMTKVPPQISPN